MKLGNLEFNSYDGLIAKSPETVWISTEGEREESIVLCSICGFQRGDFVSTLGIVKGGGTNPVVFPLLTTTCVKSASSYGNSGIQHLP